MEYYTEQKSNVLFNIHSLYVRGCCVKHSELKYDYAKIKEHENLFALENKNRGREELFCWIRPTLI